METAEATDERIGYSVLFGALGLVGGLVMLASGLTGDQILSGWGFAGAMAAATLLVTVLHLHD